MVLWWNWLLILTTLTSLIYLTNEEKVLGESDDEFDFDGLPGASHEFKLEVAAGSENCFFQKIKRGANLHITFEVLRGGDKDINLYLYGPDDRLLESHQMKQQGTVEKPVESDGSYQICIENTFSRFSSKLVYIYLVTFVMDEWTNYIQELEDMEITVVNFTTSISGIQESLVEVLKYQALSRMTLIKDWYTIEENNAHIQNWSIFLCIIIIATSGFQTYFVRRLFFVPNVTPTTKPRA